MSEDDKVDLIAAILAAGWGGAKGSTQLVDVFRTISGRNCRPRASTGQSGAAEASRSGGCAVGRQSVQDALARSIRQKLAGAPAMTSEQFAEALSQLVSDAEDAGLPSEEILAKQVAMTEAMQLCLEE